MPKLKSLIKALPQDFVLTLADVGSAGGLKSRWEPLESRLRGLLFDPREGGSVVEIGRNRSYPVALGERAEMRELRITAIPILSSLLEPSRELLTLYRKKGDQGTVRERVTVQLEALDTLMRRDGIQVDAMKIDTQGTELEILKGSVEALERSVLVVEAEMSLFERYRGQVVAPELMSWMLERGFQIIEFSRPKRYIRLNSFGIGNVGIGDGHRAGQLGHGDALFVATDAHLERRWKNLPHSIVQRQALALIVLLLVYGKVDIAAAMFDRHQQVLDAPVRSVLHAWLKRWRNAEFRTRGLHAIADYLARQW